MVIRTRLTLELTDKCNFNCAFCRPVRRQKGLDLDFDTAVRCLDAVKDQTICGIYMNTVQFNGNGEALLYPRLDEMIVEARKRFPMAEFVTNGSLLTEKRVESLLNTDIDLIEISLTGVIPEVYQHFQGSGIPYEQCVRQLERVINNVKTLLRKRDEMGKNTYIRLRYIRDRELGSYQHFKDYVKYWKDSGVDEIFVTSLWDMARRPKFDPQKLKVIRCHNMNSSMQICSNGVVFSCSCNFDPKRYGFGNVYETPVEDIVTSEEFLTDRANKLTTDLDRVPRTCLSCENRAYRTLSDMARNRRMRVFFHKPVKNFFYRAYWIVDILYVRLNRSDLFFKYFWAYVCRKTKKDHDNFRQNHLRTVGDHR